MNPTQNQSINPFNVQNQAQSFAPPPTYGQQISQNLANYLQNQQQQMPQRFSSQHNQMYENLRNVLMRLHQSGMPGIDKVLNTLNQQHVSQMKSPTMPGLAAGMTMPMTFPQMPQSTMQPLAESIGTPSIPGSLGAMQEAMQTSRGFPLLAKLDQVIRSGDQNSIQDVTKAIMSDPKYKEYWSSLPRYTQAAGIGGNITLDALLPLISNLSTMKRLMQPRMPQQITRS